MRLPSYEIGYAAGRLAIRRVGDGEASDAYSAEGLQWASVEPELVVRQSVSPPV